MSIYSTLPEPGPAGIPIRVLELLPSADRDAEVKCKLRQVDIGVLDNRFFEAVSYTWAGQPTQLISVNNLPKLITDNLLSFLRRRREQHESVLLWVDAICINQEDASEKSIQVGIMNLIYMTAVRTTIWLGSQSSDSDLAVDTLADLGRTTPYEKMQTLSREAYEAMQNLLNRPWWSRAWIVQEVILGGAGTKLVDMRVMCGPREILWTTLVLGAVRMNAHQEDLRQHFPNVVRILELDKVRDTSRNYLMEGTTPADVLSLLARYRSCQASDARDKVFAFSGLFRARPDTPTQILRPDYELSTEQTYINFALFMLSFDEGLDLIRHCGRRCVDLPSWVPDWSSGFNHIPLPSNSGNWYTDVPWWAEPVEMIVNGKPTMSFESPAYPLDPVLAQQARQARIKRLQMDVDGFGMIRHMRDLPPSFQMNQTPDDLKAQMQSLLETGRVAMFVADEPEPRDGSAQTAQVLKQRDRRTERSMKHQILKQLKESKVPYRAAADTERSIGCSHDIKHLITKGIVWDRVKTVHEGFPKDIDTNWRDATKFMVAVGQCKLLAMQAAAQQSPYPDERSRLEAFWSTLFVGQIAEPDRFEKTGHRQDWMKCESWLPEINKSWKPTPAPVTTLTTGHLELAEKLERFKVATEKASDELSSASDGPGGRLQVKGAIEFAGLCDATWSEEETKTYDEQFQDLAATWQTQPYDLYHRPFRLLRVIPDPYWETRKLEDARALETTKAHISRGLIFGSDTESSDPNVPSTFQQALLDSLHQTPSMTPQETLEPGIEKYALGRRFFVTNKGYFGLGPEDTRENDAIGVLCGCDVPFVLRVVYAEREEVVEEWEWEVVGECYVQGIMDGEVIDEVEEEGVRDIVIC